MKKAIYQGIRIMCLSWCSIWPNLGFAQSSLINDVQVNATTELDVTTGIVTYQYVVTNGAENHHDIGIIRVDITRQVGSFQPTEEGLVHEGLHLRETGEEKVALLRERGIEIIPVGISSLSQSQSQVLWVGDIGPRGHATWLNLGARFHPGESTSGFKMSSHGVPGIRAFTALAEHAPEEFPATEDDAIIGAFVDSLVFRTETLGPAAVAPGSFGHWDHLRDELKRAVDLGWITDVALSNVLVAQLANAREAMDARDGTLAKTRLQPLLDTLAQSLLSQRRQEAHDLVLLNVQSLIQNTENTPIPLEPQATLIPKDQQLTLGQQYTLTATLINLADNQPISGFPLTFEVVEGPHVGMRFDGTTDLQGKINISFTGEVVGRDRIRLLQEGELITDFGEAKVEWTGGPDLVVPFFIPPVLLGEGGGTLFVTERTANLGNVASAPSITRYFLSTQEPVDPSTARVIGERSVPQLEPGGAQGETSPLQFILPSDLPSGHYFMAACADAPAVVVELNEENNCSFNDVPGKTFVVPMGMVSNLPPDCSKAFPSVTRLWPPNHKLATVTIQGATDSENDPIQIRVTRITQDEPVNGLGDGDTGPDGFGLGSAQAQVRAERSGTGNGRVYAVAFTAEDGQGGSCNGNVQVGVPHDQGKGATPINDGQKFDSTLP